MQLGMVVGWGKSHLVMVGCGPPEKLDKKGREKWLVLSGGTARVLWFQPNLLIKKYYKALPKPDCQTNIFNSEYTMNFTQMSLQIFSRQTSMNPRALSAQS